MDENLKDLERKLEEIGNELKDLKAKIQAAEKERKSLREQRGADLRELKKDKQHLKGQEMKKAELLRLRSARIGANCKEALSKKRQLIDEIRAEANVAQNVKDFAYSLEYVECHSSAALISPNDEDYIRAKIHPEINAVFPQGGVKLRFLQRAFEGTHFRTNCADSALLFAHILGNTIFTLCQPSPKWNDFRDFWREALGQIWMSAHNNPDVWHILIIENFNIVCPKIWGTPLWDLLEEIANVLPVFGNPTFPKNLKIFVSLASTDLETGIGIQTDVADNWPLISFTQPLNWKGDLRRKLKELNRKFFFCTEGGVTR